MAEKKDINPFLKQVLELGPPLAFFFIYLRLRDDNFVIGGAEYSGFIVATILIHLQEPFILLYDMHLILKNKIDRSSPMMRHDSADPIAKNQGRTIKIPIPNVELSMHFECG